MYVHSFPHKSWAKLVRRNKINLTLKNDLVRIALAARLAGMFFLKDCKYTTAELAHTWYIFHPYAGFFILLRPRLGQGTGATSTPLSRTRVRLTHAHACMQRASWQKRQHDSSLRSMTWFQLDSASRWSFVYQRAVPSDVLSPFPPSRWIIDKSQTSWLWFPFGAFQSIEPFREVRRDSFQLLKIATYR